MRGRDDGRFEKFHLTCPVCGALPGTTCLDEDFQELERIHPSRRVSVAERNRRYAVDWEPPELAERHREEEAARAARAPLYNPPLKSRFHSGRKALRSQNPPKPARRP
jgi:hypothetical protein